MNAQAKKDYDAACKRYIETGFVYFLNKANKIKQENS